MGWFGFLGDGFDGEVCHGPFQMVTTRSLQVDDRPLDSVENPDRREGIAAC